MATGVTRLIVFASMESTCITPQPASIFLIVVCRREFDFDALGAGCVACDVELVAISVLPPWSSNTFLKFLVDAVEVSVFDVFAGGIFFCWCKSVRLIVCAVVTEAESDTESADQRMKAAKKSDLDIRSE
jgi:hypothetical protein